MKFRAWDINLKIRLIGEIILFTSFWMVFPFLTIYFSQTMGYTLTSILLVFTQLFAAVISLFGGYFSDHYGRKRMLSLSVFGEGVGFLVFAIGVSPAFYFPPLSFFGFTVASVFLSFYIPASQAMITDVVKPEHRSYVFSVFYMVTNITLIVGPVIGSITFQLHKSHTLILIALAHFFLFFLFQKCGYETAPTLFKPKLKTSSPKKNSWHIFIQQLRGYQFIFKDKILFLYILAGLMVAQAFMQFDLLLPLYIKDVIGDSALFDIFLSAEQLFGLIISINGLCVALLAIIVTKLMTRFKEKFVFVNASFLYGIAILLFAFLSTPGGAILAMIVFTFAELMTVGIQQNFISKIAPENKRAMYFSAAELRYTVGKVIAPFMITLSTFLHYRLTFIIIAILAALSGFIYLYMYNTYEKQGRKNL